MGAVGRNLVVLAPLIRSDHFIIALALCSSRLRAARDQGASPHLPEATMTISFRCPCSRKLGVKDELVGKRAVCPECAVKSVVPQRSTEDEVPRRRPVADEDEDAPRRRPTALSAAPRQRAVPAADVDDADEDDDPRPSRRSGSRKSRRSSGSGQVGLAIVLVAVASLLLLGGGGFAIWYFGFRSSAKSLDQASSSSKADSKGDARSDRAAAPGSEEQTAIQAIEKLGGTITRDDKQPGRPVVAVDLSGSRNSVVTDAELKDLEELEQLQTLHLSWTQVTDAGLKNLEELEQLQTLHPTPQPSLSSSARTDTLSHRQRTRSPADSRVSPGKEHASPPTTQARPGPVEGQGGPSGASLPGTSWTGWLTSITLARAKREGRPVDEAKWLTCEDPGLMLTFLHDKGSERKVRLLACASCRAMWSLIKARDSRTAIDVAERFADRLAHEGGLSRAYAGARSVARKTSSNALRTGDLNLHAALWHAAETCARNARWVPRRYVLGEGRSTPICGLEAGKQVVLIREIYGNPFHPVVLDSACLTTIVVALAEAAYQQRSLPDGHIDLARIAVLSDALEDAGCTDRSILDHLRGPGPHVRGCFAVDLVLGKS
jgi:hypothetical protein